MSHELPVHILFLFYIVQVTRCEEIVEDGNAQLYPNGLDNMTLLEQHPELAMLPAGFLVGANNDQLQGPWRNIRFCKNDGEPQAFLNVLNHHKNFAKIKMLSKLKMST